MADLGFIHSSSNHALFYYNEMNTAAIIVRICCLIGWHVDDGMAVSNSRPFLQKVKQRITKQFGLKDLGPIAKYLRVQFEHDQQSCKIWMHQNEYIAFLLQEYNLLDCNPIHLPADPKVPLGDPNSIYPEVPDIQSTYMKLIGELIYLLVNTHPDIAYIINALAQHSSNPEPCHYAAGKCVLHYLAGTTHLKVQYTAESNNKDLHVYANASWANKTGCQSISRYVWYYAGGLISHISKKQTTVALLSTKAEYMAVTHIIQEGLWIHSLFKKLNIPFQSPMPIHLNNSVTIALLVTAKFHQHTKHINICYHFIRFHINDGSFTLIWIPSHINIADILTKALPCPTFNKLRISLGLITL